MATASNSSFIKSATAERMLLAVVLILLSANAVAQEKRCYWCGPLAEQVHRSQRAPPCEPFEQQTTVCDEGYKHCAVVATSPPYIESRLCVKFYQDECYSLYCNSTRTWRMVCPCRGNLCNGQNTDREINAFASLNKIVAKANSRNKRDVVKGFFNIRTRARDNTTIGNNTKPIVAAIDTQNNDQQSIEIILQNTTMINSYSNQYNDDIIIEHGSTDSITKNNDDVTISMPTTAVTTVEDNKKMRENELPTAETPEMPTTMKPSTIQFKVEENNKMKENDLPKAETPEMPTTMKPTTIQIEVAVINKYNEKDNMPPAEALQHNVTPTVTEHTTMATIEVSTNDNMMMTTESSKVKKNLATRVVTNIVPIVLSSFSLINIY